MEAVVWVCFILMMVFGMAILAYVIVLRREADPLPLKMDKKLSILVAARNEEGAILECLRSLDALDYPKENLQILIGDDDSDDRTAETIQAFIADKPHFNYHFIQGQLNGLRGKQNVLAQLGRVATGELLLVTDADIRVHPKWAQAMAGAFAAKRTGIVCGPSVVWGKSLFAKVQGLDWLMGQSISYAHVRLGIPISAVGNNMGIRASAYRQAGGYESLPFNIIEDFQLYHTLCEKGEWNYRLHLHPSIGAVSLPVETLPEWLKQRKRWFKGARDLAWYNLALITLNALVLPAITTIWILHGPKVGLGLLSFKLLADFNLLFWGAVKMRMVERLIWFIPYEFYYLFSMVATPLLMILPGAVTWKGRRYT